MIDFANIWWQISLVYSFVLVFHFGLNGYFKADGAQLTFLRSFFALIFFTLVSPFADWPTDPYFYIIATLAIIPGTIGDIMMYNAVSRFGAAAVSRILPLRIWGLFIAWSLFHPAMFESLIETPFRSSGIVAALVIGVLALFKMKTDKISGQALKALIPVIILYVIMDALYKPAAAMAPTFAGALALGFVFCLVITLTSGCYIVATKRYDGLFDKQILKAGLATGFIFVIVIFGKNLAMIGVPNPAYFSAITMLYAVWLTIYHKLRGIPDSSSIKAGIVFVFSALLLVLLTA